MRLLLLQLLRRCYTRLCCVRSLGSSGSMRLVVLCVLGWPGRGIVRLVGCGGKPRRCVAADWVDCGGRRLLLAGLLLRPVLRLVFIFHACILQA